MFRNFIIPVLFANGLVLSGVIENESQHCSSSEFACPDGSCVGSDRVCDGVSDCADRSDEAACIAGANSSLVLGEISRREKRQSGCGRDEWRCRDGTCIPFYGKCDGLVDCPDGSDETHPLCRNTPCQDNLFRCTYGGCADGTAPCNGVQECADNSDELHPSCLNETRIDKQSGQYRCNNGQQISATGLCDGERDCLDGSDETIETCAGNTCVSYLIQCAYGACVDAGSYCNGIQDCADGSDESDELCNRTTTAVVSFSSKTCVLPPYPANGRYEVRGRRQAQPGQRYTDAVFINVTCDPGYAVDGNGSQIVLPCFRDIASSFLIPKCKPYCELRPHHSVEYQCSLKVGETTLNRRCGDREFVGTKVIPTCRAPNYRGEPSYMYCTKHGWNHIAKCDPDCGKTTPVGQKYIVNGERAKHGEIPWHAGIYDKTESYKQICGGSLVSTTNVISAAHCFWIDGEGKRSPHDYAVALGKVFRSWDDPNDQEAQVSDVREIHIPDQFHGVETNFQYDIAIVKLEKEIEYRTFIRPVCVDFNYNYNARQLTAGMLGKVAGWGLTSANGSPSEVLQVVELPFVTHKQCYDDSPEDFREYINGDKICAGFLNGTALCEGDSGGGLAFPEKEHGVQRYYLRGIVSTAPRNNEICDPFQRTTFTQILIHEHFIREHE